MKEEEEEEIHEIRTWIVQYQDLAQSKDVSGGMSWIMPHQVSILKTDFVSSPRSIQKNIVILIDVRETETRRAVCEEIFRWLKNGRKATVQT